MNVIVTVEVDGTVVSRQVLNPEIVKDLRCHAEHVRLYAEATAWNPAGLPAYDVPPVPLADAIDEALSDE